ncbi:alpha/beta hydrolase [Pigmentiphaga sp. YJ18]|uniref:alpha/beta fold hydrolase n=1 Tax=Pigmentiphaga sp. YJ18 TaxID=3134907 RepID=UPI003114034D
MVGSSDPRWKEGFTALGDTRLHYVEAGQGEPLILLHSNGSSVFEFQFVIEDLARRHHVYAIDLPGQGDSDPLVHHWTYPMYARAVAAFMDEHGLAQATVLGTSIGGVICLALAEHHAQRMRAVILVETPIRSAQAWADRWAYVESNFALPIQTFDNVAARLGNLTPELHQRWNIDRSKAGAHAMMDAMWALREYDAPQGLARSQVPTYAILGSKGPVGDSLDALRQALPPDRLSIMEGCGHFPMIEDPARFVEHVERYTGSR